MDSISNQTQYITMLTTITELNLPGVVLHETVEIGLNWLFQRRADKYIMPSVSAGIHPGWIFKGLQYLGALKYLHIALLMKEVNHAHKHCQV